MRGSILMSLLAVFAALSLHYLKTVAQARAPEAARSDPVAKMEIAFPYDEGSDDVVAATDVDDIHH